MRSLPPLAKKAWRKSTGSRVITRTKRLGNSTFAPSPSNKQLQFANDAVPTSALSCPPLDGHSIGGAASGGRCIITLRTLSGRSLVYVGRDSIRSDSIFDHCIQRRPSTRPAERLPLDRAHLRARHRIANSIWQIKNTAGLSSGCHWKEKRNGCQRIGA